MKNLIQNCTKYISSIIHGYWSCLRCLYLLGQNKISLKETKNINFLTVQLMCRAKFSSIKKKLFFPIVVNLIPSFKKYKELANYVQ